MQDVQKNNFFSSITIALQQIAREKTLIYSRGRLAQMVDLSLCKILSSTDLHSTPQAHVYAIANDEEQCQQAKRRDLLVSPPSKRVKRKRQREGEVKGKVRHSFHAIFNKIAHCDKIERFTILHSPVKIIIINNAQLFKTRPYIV